MTVAVQKGLETIKEKLRQKNYDVVVYGEYTGNVDAIVYTDTGYVPSFNMSASSSDFTSFSELNRSFGTLMVNATNKTVEQIDLILRKRTYTPLF